MSLCYDFQKWTMITLASIAISLTTGLVTLAYGQTVDNQRFIVEDRYSFQYPSNWNLTERQNRFTETDAYLKNEDSSLILFQRINRIHTGTNDSITPEDLSKQWLQALEDRALTYQLNPEIYESGIDKYFINNQSAPYVISKWSKQNIFGTYNFVQMDIVVWFGNNHDAVICHYVSPENDFDKHLTEVEEIFRSVREIK